MTIPSTPTPQADSAADPGHLETGQLGRASLVSLSLASFFPAVGVALVPLLVFTTAGTNAWQASLLATIAVICVGRAVTVFARRYVATGSLYSYIGEVFGPWARYLTGAALLAGFIAAIGALAAVVGIFAGSFLLSHGVGNALSFWPQLAIFVVALVVAGAIAYRGLDTSVSIAVTLAVLSFPLVLVITIASAAKTGLDLADQFSLGEFSLGGTLQGMAVGAAFLVGFESCTALAAETRNPRRNVPLAVMSVPVLLGGLFPIVTILQVPGLKAASAELNAGMSAPAALALHAGLGSGVATASDLVLAVATFAALIGFINYGARFAMTLAADGLLPASLGRIHPRHHSPFVSIAVMTAGGLILVTALVLAAGDVVSAYYTVAPLVVYLWVLPYVLITIGAIVLTLRGREFRPFVIAASVVGAVGTAWMYINGVINPPPAPANAMSWVVLVVLAVVLGVFAVSRRRTSQALDSSAEMTAPRNG